MKNAFDEIARKNWMTGPHDATKLDIEAIKYSSRLAQAAVEATMEHVFQQHIDADYEMTGLCPSGPDCQSDILRRTQEIYEKGKS